MLASALTTAQIEKFRGLVVRKLGLSFEDGRLEYLTEALQKRCMAVGSPSPDHYLKQLESGGTAEFRELATQLTVGETYFFRNRDHFHALLQEILPALLRARRGQRSLRFLSAGCATGEEAYTLAILLREYGAELAGWQIAIDAIDVNPAALEKARRARYSAWSLRDTPTEVRERYFQAAGRDFVLDSGLRSMVRFEERNLIQNDATFFQPDTFDVVFCRNVMMYFTTELSRAIVERFARSLRPGGHLFLGHAETLRGVSNDFHLRHTHSTFYYQKRSEAEGLRSRHSSWPPVAHPQSDTSGLGPLGEANVAQQHALPIAPSTDVSWVEAIARASANIAELAKNTGEAPSSWPPATAAAAPSHDGPRWDTRQALQLLREERFSEALERLGNLPADSHTDPEIKLLRAVLLTNTGQLKDAERICTELLAQDDLDAGAHYLTALAREHGGDLDGALEHNQMAVYLDPTFAMPRLHIGILARRAKKPDLARQELQRALTLLLREDAARILLFGGGFSREALSHLCRTELQALEARR